MGIHILGTGSYTPPCTLTNADLSEMVEANDEWIRTRTGISVRHVSDGEPTWYMGVQAAQQAIATAGIDPADIGLIIDTTITGEFCTPSMSCIIQRETKAVNAACFDLNAACSGFVYAMDTAHRFLMTDPHMNWWLPMKAYPKLPTTATVLPAFCSEMVQPLQSLNMLRMPCIPVIWVQMERGQNISMHTVHCHAPRS